MPLSSVSSLSFVRASLAFVVLAAAVLLSASSALAQQSPTLAAKSWLLYDFTSGQTLVAQAADEQIEPASLTKLMTAYLSFAALKEGKIKRDTSVPVSEKAWRTGMTGASRMFIQVGTRVSVENLIKGMIVQSGNDACVALAETISGSEPAFVEMMNREAQRLGLKHTHFTNTTGLPDPEHYSTARDLATLATALIRDFPEEYASYYSIKEFTYNKIRQENRNRLLWSDPSVDGMKTGWTERAGYCLIASARRGQRRLISVVLGASSQNARGPESQKLLNYGFQFFDAVQLFAARQPISELRVWKGASNVVKAGFAEGLVVTVPKDQAKKLSSKLVSQQPLLAPVHAGQQVGTVKISIDDTLFAEYPAIALENVPEAGFFGRLWDSLRLLFN
ncbi:MAG: D-alanyl-D-alanine carboxypeptidase [Betaproteobacteria bacterium]|nr:D-alanyl-D-alanine carboxypeptidase [Betaproteobacteria bacterium]